MHLCFSCSNTTEQFSVIFCVTAEKQRGECKSARLYTSALVLSRRSTENRNNAKSIDYRFLLSSVRFRTIRKKESKKRKKERKSSKGNGKLRVIYFVTALPVTDLYFFVNFVSRMLTTFITICTRKTT
jgi:hypothetical protein